MLNKLANIGLRGITLASKFALLLVLAKYLEPSDVGLYGLIAVTVAYGMYPLDSSSILTALERLLRLKVI